MFFMQKNKIPTNRSIFFMTCYSNHAGFFFFYFYLFIYFISPNHNDKVRFMYKMKEAVVHRYPFEIIAFDRVQATRQES